MHIPHTFVIVCQFSKVLYIAIDNAHTLPQMVLDCRPGVGGLNKVVRLPFIGIKHDTHSYVVKVSFSVHKLIPKNSNDYLIY